MYNKDKCDKIRFYKEAVDKLMELSEKNDRELIFEIATTIREQFIEILESSIKTNQTQGSCLYACTLLKIAYVQFTDFEILCRGGDGQSSGFKDSSGVMHGHYWLAIKTQGCTFIVDITADQFGYPAIIVENETSSIAYIPGDQENIDTHFEEVWQSVRNSSKKI